MIKRLKKRIKSIRGNAWHINIFILYMVILAGWGMYISYSTISLVSDADYWEVVSKQFSRENIVIPAPRGSILSCDGQLLSASVPEYRLYMDYRVISPNERQRDKAQSKRDSLYDANLDSLVTGLADIFPDHDEKWFRERLSRGKKNYQKRVAEREEPGSCTWMIYDKLANHNQYKACLRLPFLRESAATSGFHGESVIKRIRLYGDLASRTIGTLYPETDSAKCGLELSYDSILRGTPGLAHSIRMRNRQVTLTDEEPISGNDLLTTIDINLQDYADKVLRKKLKEETVRGEIGVAIVMEVKTGDVKAIVNLMRGADGKYYEMKNHAVSDLMEPGSTFKTASIMVAMEDDYITEHSTIDCMGGIFNMHGRNMKDHDWLRGGHGVLTVSEILEQSSNIGVSRIIDNHYGSNPQKFVDGLRREGMGVQLDLPFVGKGEARIPSPSDSRHYWSKTDLPWMSIGYVTLLPPISTLTFYNAIANDGVMVKPRFLKAEVKDGQIVKEYPTEIINPRICSDNTIKQIQHCLEHVVSKGLGKKAGNGGKYFKVSGKTGTAQYAQNGSYAGRKYMVSFCGYFPSDAPRYSCIVCIVKQGLPASGGGQCGPVFREISEYAMGHGSFQSVEDIDDIEEVGHDSVIVYPEYVEDDSMTYSLMPDMIGLGARDAVFMLQQRGLKVKLSGAGRVISQSIPVGQQIKKGQHVSITLKTSNK